MTFPIGRGRGHNKKYIAGVGSVSEYPQESRGANISLGCRLFSGKQSPRGPGRQGRCAERPACSLQSRPCRAAGPVRIHKDSKDEGVQFYGVNARDDARPQWPSNGPSPWASLSFDDNVGGILPSMTWFVLPRAVPATRVLDKQGQVSARILGISSKAP